jgi:hypothetical protein
MATHNGGAEVMLLDTEYENNPRIQITALYDKGKTLLPLI